MAAPSLPLTISLHGSDVFVAEKFGPARAAARIAFERAGAVTACSDDLGRRAAALGAVPERLEVVPYGVDVERFRPDAAAAETLRHSMRIPEDTLLAFTAGRLVKKKGFEYLIDALPRTSADVVLAIAGEGDLDHDLRTRARHRGVETRVHFLGNLSQDDVARYLAAADVAVVPSVRDDAGNVDGLPNVVMEALASGTPLVTTAAGGIGAVVTDGQDALVVPERDPGALADALARIAADRPAARRLGEAARGMVREQFGWARTAARIEAAYDRALAFKSRRR
jgi:glycosyltransferase involved in cell wall biosynthesis